MKHIWTIINQYFPKGTLARNYYIPHVESVTKKALEICRNHPEFNANCHLVETSAMLHDIGICRVNAPEIGCFGNAPYIQHGILGAEIVRQAGLSEIAPFCENHIGVGITITDIQTQHLPLPERNMIPDTIEQKIVAYVDKFFSKSQKYLTNPKPIEKIHKSLLRYGAEKVSIFDQWHEFFEKKYDN